MKSTRVTKIIQSIADQLIGIGFHRRTQFHLLCELISELGGSVTEQRKISLQHRSLNEHQMAQHRIPNFNIFITGSPRATNKSGILDLIYRKLSLQLEHTCTVRVHVQSHLFSLVGA